MLVTVVWGRVEYLGIGIDHLLRGWVSRWRWWPLWHLVLVWLV